MWCRAKKSLLASASPVCRSSRRPCATRSSRRPASASAVCPSARKTWPKCLKNETRACSPRFILATCGKLLTLLRRRQKNLSGRQKLHVGNFRRDANALKFPLFPAVIALERQQILVIEMFLDLVEVGLQRDRPVRAEIVRFRAGFLGKLAEVGLRVERPEESAANVPARVVNRPDIHVLLLRALDGGLQVR